MPEMRHTGSPMLPMWLPSVWLPAKSATRSGGPCSLAGQLEEPVTALCPFQRWRQPRQRRCLPAQPAHPGLLCRDHCRILGCPCHCCCQSLLLYPSGCHVHCRATADSLPAVSCHMRAEVLQRRPATAVLEGPRGAKQAPARLAGRMRMAENLC